MKGRAVSIVVGFGLLTLGVTGMTLLFSLKEEPAEATKPDEERTLRVETAAVQPQDISVTMHGYGEVRARRTILVAPEVAGTVTSVHPNLEVGGRIPAGEPLFSIDAASYDARVAEARAVAGQWDTTVKRLEVELENDRARLHTLQRTRDLAKAEHGRALGLRDEGIGNQTEADNAERALNAALDLADQLERQLAVYPLRIEEAGKSRAAAGAKLKLAEIELSKTRLMAPFDARVMSMSVEAGQYVAPGVAVMTLADDALLEIPVRLDARDARQWLKFDGMAAVQAGSWFSELQHVPCQIRWTEETDGYTWTGTLGRVEEYDPASRTLTVAVQISGKAALECESLPLVAGMFCEVTIPGRDMTAVYELPQWAVTVAQTVYVEVNGRLKTVPVEVVRTEGDKVYVASGLHPADNVIVTRLVNPLENTLLEAVREDFPESSPAPAAGE